MTHMIDVFDRKILKLLQHDTTLSMDALAEKVGLSRNACWRRVRMMEDAGIITGRVALVDPSKLDHGQSVIVMIRAGAHSVEWLDKFERAIQSLPEIVGAYRTSGDLDYVLQVRVADVQDYDRFYQTLIRRVPIANVSASFVMQEMKETTAVPV
jgi:Lrp/AsnC family transcriptional regulator